MNHIGQQIVLKEFGKMIKDYRKMKDEMKSKGEIPEWYSSNALQFFMDKYSYEGESVKSRDKTVAKTLAKFAPEKKPKWWDKDPYTKGKSYEEVFFNVVWDGYAVPSTPLKSNAGLPSRGLTVSCCGQHMENNLASKAFVRGELEVLIKNSHGCSLSVSDWLSEGTVYDSDGNISDGIIPVIDELQDSTQAVSQNIRRGQTLLAVNVLHCDFDRVANKLYAESDSLNISWLITDEFVGLLKNGDKEAVRKFGRILQIRMRSGKGYLTFIDKMNRNKAQVFKDNNLKVQASNLCVVGSERVPSNRGMYTAKQLYEQGGELALFDNSKVVKSSAMKLVEKGADVYKITLENGMEHTVTGYHKVKSGKNMVSCEDLVVGDKVSFQTNEGLFGSVHKPEEAFLLGQYQADGTQNNGRIMFCLWEDSFDLVSEIEESISKIYANNNLNYSSKTNRSYPTPTFGDSWVGESSSKSGRKVAKKMLSTNRITEVIEGFVKGVVPEWIWLADKETQWQYIRGLFFADGTVNVAEDCVGQPIYLSITSTNEGFLKDLQKILANLGTNFSIFTSYEEGFRKMPDGKGGYKDYWCKKAYRMVCGSKNDALLFNKNTGFLDRKGVVVEDRKYRDNTKKSSKVKSVTYEGKQDVYCVTVDSKEHLWVCNGVITSNCNEVNLPANEDYSFTCVIINANLAVYDNFPEHLFHILHIMQDCNVSNYISEIEKKTGLNALFLSKVLKFTKDFRAVGTGVCGFHSYLMKKRIVFGSMESMLVNEQIFKRMKEEITDTSKWLASVLGEPPMMKGTGLRNATTMMMPPTKSSAELAKDSPTESINPETALIRVKETVGGDIFRINTELLKVMKELGQYNKENVAFIAENKGSVQKCDWMPQELKDVFRNAFEIPMEAHLDLCSQRQKHIDQQQSINLYFSGDDNPEYIAEMHKKAMLDDWCNGLYYCYSSRGGSYERFGCEMCE